jgi:hypothetical protein
MNYKPVDISKENGTFLPNYFNQWFNNGYGMLKVIIGANVLKKRKGTILKGNHFVHLPSTNQAAAMINLNTSLGLAHYPIRSVEQAMTKAVVGWANILCIPGRNPNTHTLSLANHWRIMYDRIKSDGTLDYDILSDFTKIYAVIAHPDSKDMDKALREEMPLVEFSFKSDIALRYTDYKKAQNNFMNIILSHYEHIIDVFMKREKAAGHA